MQMRRADEDGVALVMALLVLLIMALLAAVLMMSVSINRKVTGHDVRVSKALNTAEAGVAEAMARIRSGDLAMATNNPRAVGQIYLCPAGSVPVLGTDSIAIETRQPAGDWLPYSTETKSADALTVSFKTDPARTVIYRYDTMLNPPVNTKSGLPIYVINSTGRQGTAVKRIVTEVIQKPVNVLAKGALVANHDIEFVGNAVVCGFNHALDTHTGDGENGQIPNPPCFDHETHVGDLYGSWTTGTTYNGGTATQAGSPLPNISNQIGFYTGPWDALGLTQADFYAWIGSSRSSIPANLNGITYLDNDALGQNLSCNGAVHGQAGEGLLYVDGDLTLNSWFNYRGLLYIEGDLILNGQAWILGGLIVRGTARVMMTGGATILYSSEAILVNLAKYGGQFVQLSWREK